MLWFLLGSLAISVSARQASRLTIINPPELKALFPNGVKNTLADFGTPIFGHEKALTATLIVANQDDDAACLPFPQDDIDSWNIQLGMPFILLVDGRDCIFIEKVRHAQDAGATAAIVMYNLNTIGVMGAGNSGLDISIPSVMIGNTDGHKILEFKNEPITVTLGWNLPHPDGRVEWSIWTSSADSASMAFKSQFDIVTRDLGSHAKMTPNYFFYSWPEASCNGNPRCLSSCIFNGTYCFPPTETLTGAMIVKENLRQMCLWRVHLADEDDPQLWFDYVTLFDKNCNTKENWNKECSDKIITELKLDPKPVGDCVVEQTTKGGKTIPMVMDQLKVQKELGVLIMPTITINAVQYRGSLDCPDPISVQTCGVLSAICAGFKSDTLPSTCTTQCPVGQVEDECGICGGTGVLDACKKCFKSPNATGFRNECVLGCDNVINSGLVMEGVCKHCGFSPDKCGDCKPVTDPDRDLRCAASGAGNLGIPVWVIVVITLAVISTVGVVVYGAMARREARQRADIDDLLAQYLPMDKSGAAPQG